MTTVLENSLPASYKGVGFHVDSINGTEGRTKVNYLFLNSGRRISKDLGPMPPEFVVSAFVYSLDGDELNDKFNAVRNVFNSDLNGVFVHPFAGEYYCSHGKLNYTHDFKELNICRFSFTLSRVSKDGDSPLTPTGELFNKSQIRGLALETNRALQAASAAAFTTSSALNKTSATELIADSGRSMKDIFGSIGQTIAKANDYADKALDIYYQADYYANNPLAGFAALADGVLGVNGLTFDIYAKFRTMQTLFNFGDDGTNTSFSNTSSSRLTDDPLTRDDAERYRNSQVLKTFVQTAATCECFAYGTEYEPTTTNEIDDILETMNDQFEKVRSLLTGDQSTIEAFRLDAPDYSDSYTLLNSLRRASDGYLRNLRANAAYIQTVTVQPQPASVLAYTLYKDSTRAEEIMGLNPQFNDNMRIYGDVQVLSK